VATEKKLVITRDGNKLFLNGDEFFTTTIKHLPGLQCALCAEPAIAIVALGNPNNLSKCLCFADLTKLRDEILRFTEFPNSFPERSLWDALPMRIVLGEVFRFNVDPLPHLGQAKTERMSLVAVLGHVNRTPSIAVLAMEMYKQQQPEFKYPLPYGSHYDV
jgi:hypothetical protein